jgi:tRNA-Thr(GGU) m(6)t(6)A37 methyltransferase TsaA
MSKVFLWHHGIAGKSDIVVGETMNGGRILAKEARLIFVGEVKTIEGEKATVNVHPKYCEGLKDIVEYSHLIILYWAHRRDNSKERRTLLVYPRRHGWEVDTGVFSCRSPSRPNPICLCVVELLKFEGCSLEVKGLARARVRRSSTSNPTFRILTRFLTRGVPHGRRSRRENKRYSKVNLLNVQFAVRIF